MKTEKIPTFKKIDAAIYEAEQFIEEARAYKKEKLTTYKNGNDKEEYYNSANNEHGTLVHRSILLAKKLVAWRKP